MQRAPFSVEHHGGSLCPIDARQHPANGNVWGHGVSCTNNKAPQKGPCWVSAACCCEQKAYWAKAEKARAVISSTLPVPLMARYLGAEAASAWAQLE
jgi:hypothetical protein